MRRALALVPSTCMFVLLSAVPAMASEATHEVNPAKDFSIIFGIALAAVVVGFIAFKTARKKSGGEEES